MKPLVLAAAAVLVGLAACQTVPYYQPLVPGTAHPTGYSEVQLAPDRWRVTFLGAKRSSHKAVEADLLYRSAQLTLKQGADWFVTVDREGAAYRVVAEPNGEGEIRQPDWRESVNGFGTANWNDPSRQDQEAEDRGAVHAAGWFEASADIVLYKGPKPADARGALDARAVQARLAPQVDPPR